MSRTAILFAVLMLCPSPGAHAQGPAAVPPQPAWLTPAWEQNGQVGVLEHASGGEPFLYVGVAAVAGLTAYDLFSVPASARRFNERQPEASQRSPGTALLLSTASTVVPAAAGALVYDASPEIGSGLFVLGVTAGPSLGHWYAGERRHAVATAGLRAAFALFTGYVYGCCT